MRIIRPNSVKSGRHCDFPLPTIPSEPCQLFDNILSSIPHHKTEEMTTESVTDRTKSYYDAPTSDAFYSTLWGGTDLHVGIYNSPTDTIADASQRTVEHLVSRLPPLTPQTRVLDLGAGYGGVARFLAKTYGCSVTCVNLSSVQNERNRALCREEGLGKLVQVIDGSFECVPCRARGIDERFHVVWSQDSFLHSGDRVKVMGEIDRLLVEEGGWVVFTDIMKADAVAASDLKLVLERLPVDDLGSVHFYTRELEKKRFVPAKNGALFQDLSEHFVTHYSKVLDVLDGENGAKVREMGGHDWVRKTREGTQAWVEAGRRSDLVWGVLCFTR